MKKDIPIALRKLFDEFYLTNPELFSVKFGEGYIVKIEDFDPNSDYYFQLTKVNPPHNSKSTYVIEYKPLNDESNTVKQVNSASLENFRGHFNIWSKNLIESNTPSPLFDDPITQGYYDDLEPKFKIIDKDGDLKAFSINQQKQLINYYTRISSFIEDFEASNLEKNEVLGLIEDAKKVVSKSSKNKTVSILRIIIAKSFKVGFQLGEKLLIEFSTELAKKLIIGA